MHTLCSVRVYNVLSQLGTALLIASHLSEQVAFWLVLPPISQLGTLYVMMME